MAAAAPLTSVFVAAAALLAGGSAAATLADDEAALRSDDECSASFGEGSPECALNALQLRRSAVQQEAEAGLGCHTTKLGEPCWNEIMWAKNEGMRQHPDWYPGLNQESSIAQIQKVIHEAHNVACPRPCLTQAPRWCAGAGAPGLWAPAEDASITTHVKILSYNLFWWSLFKQRGGNGDSVGKLIQANMEPAFDVMGFQECEDLSAVLRPSGLDQTYEGFLGTHSICMAYNKKAWQLITRGEGDVAEDMATRYYGKRGSQWMRLRHIETNRTLFFINHHGPLSVNSGGACGGEATANNLLWMMAKYGREGDTIVLVGDFNANAGSLTIQKLWPHLVHVFVGRSFGGVDNIFSNVDVSSVKETKILGPGGSDHDAIAATLRVGGPPPLVADPGDYGAAPSADAEAPPVVEQQDGAVASAPPAGEQQASAPELQPEGSPEAAEQQELTGAQVPPAAESADTPLPPAAQVSPAEQRAMPPKEPEIAASQAVQVMTGEAKPGYDWQWYWCGLVEADTNYEFAGAAWTRSLVEGMLDPDRCCRACQAESACAAWTWKDYSEVTNGHECILKGGVPSGKHFRDGFVSGLAYQASAREASVAAQNAIAKVVVS